MAPTDKKHAIQVALEAFFFGQTTGKSERQIAEHVGCDRALVKRVKSEVLTSQQVIEPPPTRTIGKDGKSYPASWPIEGGSG